MRPSFFSCAQIPHEVKGIGISRSLLEAGYLDGQSLRNLLHHGVFEQFEDPIRGYGERCAKGTLQIVVPDPFFREYFLNHYAQHLMEESGTTALEVESDTRS